MNFRNTIVSMLLIGTLCACAGSSGTTGSGNEGSESAGENGEPSIPAAATILPFAFTIGGSKTDGAVAVQQTADNGFIIAGNTSSEGAGDDDAWLIKLDSQGSVEWQKAYGGIHAENFHSVVQTEDDGFIVSGYTSSFGSGSSDLWVVKTNSEGTIEWENAYGGADFDCAWSLSSIQQTSDGGYVVASETKSFGAGQNDGWVLKLASDGSIEWQKTYGGTAADTFYSIKQTTDGGFIVVGTTESYGSGGWILKLSALGAIEWQKKYVGELYSVIQASDGDFVAFGNGLINLDANGDETRQYNLYGTSIQQTRDGGFVLIGETTSQETSDDLWLLKLSEGMEVEWQKTFGGAYSDGTTARSITQTSDDGYIVVSDFGTMNDDTHISDHSAWIIKTDGNGEILFDPSAEISTGTVQISVATATGGIDSIVVSTSDTNVIPVASGATVTDTTETPISQTLQ